MADIEQYAQTIFKEKFSIKHEGLNETVHVHNEIPGQKPLRLKPGQVSIIQAEINTGIVLKISGERFLGAGEIYAVCNTLAEADSYIKNKMIENPDLEFLLYDSQGIFIKMTSRLGTKTAPRK